MSDDDIVQMHTERQRLEALQRAQEETKLKRRAHIRSVVDAAMRKHRKPAALPGHYKSPFTYDQRDALTDLLMELLP
jgi:hypothetical protein